MKSWHTIYSMNKATPNRAGECSNGILFETEMENPKFHEKSSFFQKKSPEIKEQQLI